MKTKSHYLFIMLALGSAIALQPATVHAQGTAFTYQGRLSNNGAPANGSYDLQFAIFDAPAGGIQIGSGLTTNAVAMSNGLFTVALDFGSGAFSTGADRWLFLSVKTNGAVSFTPLTLPQHITATPYAITAGNLSGSLPGTSLGGTYANAVTLNNAANSFNGNGAGLTSVNAATLGGLGAGNFWVVGGNGSTGGLGLGTADSQPLKLIAGNRRVLQLETKTVSLGLFESWSAVNTLGGASGNVISNGVMGGTIAGGGAVTNHLLGSDAGPNTVLDNFGTVGGGLNNTAGYASADFDDARAATVAGGENNTANGPWCTVSGGDQNTSSGLSAAVGGGALNTVNNNFATVAGGYFNTASGEAATVPGGYLNNATGTASFAAGLGAQATHDGTFVWADYDVGNPFYYSTGTNQFCIRARGGIQIEPQTSMYFGNTVRQMLNLFGDFYGIGVQSYTLYFRTDGNSGGFSWFKGGVHSDNQNDAGGGQEMMRLDSAGNLKTLTGTIASLSDRNAKTAFQSVDAQAVLARVAALPISTWRYKTADPAQRHLGPMAQDFYGAFGIGLDDKSICTVDEGGVALAAIQGLNQKLEQQAREKDAEIEALKARLEKLEALIKSPANSQK